MAASKEAALVKESVVKQQANDDTPVPEGATPSGNEKVESL